MEMTSRSYAELADRIVNEGEGQRARAIEELDALARDDKFFVTGFGAALAKHTKRAILFPLLLRHLERSSSARIWSALVLASATPDDLQALSGFVDRLDTLSAADAMGQLIKALDRLPKKAQPRAQLGMASRAPTWLTAQQWHETIGSVVGMKAPDPLAMLELVDAIRAAHASGDASLTSDDWARLLKFLLDEKLAQAFARLLDYTLFPAPLIDTLCEAVTEKGGRFRTKSHGLLTLSRTRHFRLSAYLDLPMVAARVAKTLLLARRHDALLRLLAQCADVGVASPAVVVSVVDGLAELQLTPPPDVGLSLHGLVRQLEPPLRGRAAYGLLQVMRFGVRVPKAVLDDILEWLAADEKQARLDTWTCILRRGDTPATPQMWSSALQCALEGQVEAGAFAQMVLASKDEEPPAHRAPGDIVPQALAHAAKTPGGLVVVLKCLSTGDESSQALLIPLLPAVERYLRSAEAEDLIDILLCMSSPAFSKPWSANRGRYGNALIASGVDALIRLVIRLHGRRLGSDELWHAIVAWVDGLKGVDGACARMAVTLALASAAHEPQDERWCTVAVPPNWHPGPLAALEKRPDARSWMTLLHRLDQAGPSASGFLAPLILAAIANGKLDWHSLVAIAQAGEALGKLHPSVHWPAVFEGVSGGDPAALIGRTSNSSELGRPIEAFVGALQALSLALVAHVSDQKALREHLLPVLACLQGEAASQHVGAVTPEWLHTLFGAPGTAPAAHGKVLEGFIEATQSHGMTLWRLRAPMRDRLDQLAQLAKSSPVDAAIVKEFIAAYLALPPMLGSFEFELRYDSFQFLTIEVPDKADVCSLLVLDDLRDAACAKSSWMRECLTLLLPSVPVVVRDESGKVVALIACELVEVDGRKAPSLYCREIRCRSGADWFIHEIRRLVPKALRRVAGMINVDHILLSNSHTLAGLVAATQERIFSCVNQRAEWTRVWHILSGEKGDVDATRQMIKQHTAELPLDEAPGQ